MKTTVLLLLAGFLPGARLAAQTADVPAAPAVTTTTATEDRYYAELLAGSWVHAETNLAQTIFTESTYQTNGTFSIQGRIGVTGATTTTGEPPGQVIDGSGVWWVNNGSLYTMVTNSASLGKNKASRYEIMALNQRHFIYKNESREIRTEQKKKP